MGKRLRELKENFTLIEILEKDFFTKVPEDYRITGDVVRDEEVVIKFPIAEKSLGIDSTVSIYAYLSDIDDSIECYTYDYSTYDFNYLYKVKLNRVVRTMDGLDFPYLKEKVNEGMAKSFTKIIFEAMAYVEYRIKEQKTIFKPLGKRNKSTVNKQSTITPRAVRKRVEVIGESKTVYLQIDGTKDFIKSVRGYNRHIDCWEVKSHTRRLKSGAVIEVKGFIKGDTTKKPNKKKILIK